MFVMSVVTLIDSDTFRVLHVGGNDIGDDGIAVISQALQNSKSLNTLDVYKCGLSVKGNVASVWILCVV